MPVQLYLSPEQLQALSIIRDLGTEKIQTIVEKLSSITPPLLRPSELRQILGELLPSDPEAIDVLVGQVISLYTLKRGRGLTTEQLLEGLRYGINRSDAGWAPTDISRWEEIEPQFGDLLSIWAVTTIVKAMDLSFDYVNLLQNSKIVTDVRPIFNEEATKIEGAIVSFTLRLYYDSIAGSQSMSIALDEQDVEKLLQTCQRALTKAETAKAFMLNSGVKKTVISGGEE